MTHASDDRFMRLALSLGRRGRGDVWPNPAVGCVIVNDGHIVGRGATAPGGRPHAEVVALDQAGDAAIGATAYVTLEPCAHTGQTPPCAEALIAAQIARVVVACSDPDPRVNGRGIAMLRAAGIAVTTDVCAARARADHIGFINRLTKARPFLTLKLATTLDGRIATCTGESQWITGPEARRAGHMLRGLHDAVMVGAGTVRADDPQLTVRGMGATRQPVRIVVSRNLDLPMKTALFGTANDVPVWLCHGPQAEVAPFATRGAVSVPCVVENGQVALADAMRALAEKGLTRVFCEGGGALAAGLLKAGLVDRLEVFQAGKVIGADGLAAVAGMEVSALTAARRFTCVGHRMVGADTWTSWDALT